MKKPEHNYRVGDLVQTFYSDTGSAVPDNVYGVVTSAGPKRVGVTWESGRRQSLHTNRQHLVKRVPNDAREEALHATRRVRAELLAKLTAKHQTAYMIESGVVRQVKS